MYYFFYLKQGSIVSESIIMMLYISYVYNQYKYNVFHISCVYNKYKKIIQVGSNTKLYSQLQK